MRLGERRQRDLFPLPLPETSGAEGVSCFDVSRGTARRQRRQLRARELVCDVVTALNCLYTGTATGVGSNYRATAGQLKAVAVVNAAVSRLGAPPSDVSPEAALSELLAKSAYGGEPATLAPLDISLLSLPRVGRRPISVTDALGESAGGKIVEALKSAVLPKELADERVRETGVRRPYSDPALRQPGTYSQVIRLLLERNLVGLRRTCRRRVGLFTVWKKSGKQRVIIDARIANAAFAEPPSVSLASGGAFASLEVDRGPSVFVGEVDLEDAFWWIALPESVVDMFGLPQVRAGDVGVSEVEGVRVRASERFHPCLLATPMGFTHALWVCQSVMEGVSSGVGAVEASRIADGKVQPSLSPVAHAEYVDNF